MNRSRLPESDPGLSLSAGVPRFVISLDFELFWGVVDSQTIASYGKNVEGEWIAIPRLLALFREFGIAATWATVGMAMCRDHRQWQEIRPAILPGYFGSRSCSYSLDRLVREHPKLFFARPLVERILACPGQEVATHTYSHFFCGDIRSRPEQFAADLACARLIADDLRLSYRSLVFPRNQIVKTFLPVLAAAGIEVYRGNSPHWLYRNGSVPPGGNVGRAARLADAWLPVQSDEITRPEIRDGLVNVPASRFLYPCRPVFSALEPLQLLRIKRSMAAAARGGGIFHLWWHPHNFGVNRDQNFELLRNLLEHFARLRERYGMVSTCMADFAQSGAGPAKNSAAQEAKADSSREENGVQWSSSISGAH